MSYNPNNFDLWSGRASWFLNDFWQPPATLDDADPEIPGLPLFTRAPAPAPAKTTPVPRRGHSGAARPRPGLRDEKDLMDILTLIAGALN